MFDSADVKMERSQRQVWVNHICVVTAVLFVVLTPQHSTMTNQPYLKAYMVAREGLGAKIFGLGFCDVVMRLNKWFLSFNILKC